MQSPRLIDDPDARLPRDEAAIALRERGFPVSKATLATRGNGPPYLKFGPRPLYRLGDLLRWAEDRLTPPRRSSSEGDAT